MLIQTCILVLVALSYNLDTFDYHEPKVDPRTGLNIFELAAFDGYPLEEHEVETEDGYLLSVHRIPHGRDNINKTHKPVVFMMHAILSSSADWINTGRESSLGYKLADLGYDVWMGNARGNTESRKHVTLDPDLNGTAFWNFSWDEMGRYDLPATIDYILTHVNQTKLQYVGYSQGSTSFYVMASSRPEYNTKIKLATTLGSPVELGNMENPMVRLLAPFTELMSKVTQTLNIREILPRTQLAQSFTRNLCAEGITQKLCKLAVSVVFGSYQNLDADRLTVFLTNIPSGCNVKQLTHYGQGVHSGIFRNYDYYSEEKNIEVYGTPEPPIYDLSRVTAPVSFVYSRNDLMVSVTDSLNVISKLTNVVNTKMIDCDGFSHIDFMWGKNLGDLLYKDIIEVMERYN